MSTQEPAPSNATPEDPFLKQTLRGICIGTADLIPGISGGTIALILGVYERLLSAIAQLNQQFIRLLVKGQMQAAFRHIDGFFLLAIGIGIVSAVIMFGRIVPVAVLIERYPEATYGLFFGLISASIVSLTRDLGVRRLLPYLWSLGGLAFGLFVVMLVPAQTPSTAIFIFFCGAMAVTAMLLPGVSGSFVLLVLGKYAELLDALSTLNFNFLLPLMAGIVTGAITFARGIKWLLDHFHTQTMLTAIGILTGSLLAVWPFQHRIYQEIGGKERLVNTIPHLPQQFDNNTLLGLFMILVGVLAFGLIERLASKSNPHREQSQTK